MAVEVHTQDTITANESPQELQGESVRLQKAQARLHAFSDFQHGIADVISHAPAEEIAKWDADKQDEVVKQVLSPLEGAFGAHARGVVEQQVKGALEREVHIQSWWEGKGFASQEPAEKSAAISSLLTKAYEQRGKNREGSPQVPEAINIDAQMMSAKRVPGGIIITGVPQQYIAELAIAAVNTEEGRVTERGAIRSELERIPKLAATLDATDLLGEEYIPENIRGAKIVFIQESPESITESAQMHEQQELIGIEIANALSQSRLFRMQNHLGATVAQEQLGINPRDATVQEAMREISSRLAEGDTFLNLGITGITREYALAHPGTAYLVHAIIEKIGQEVKQANEMSGQERQERLQELSRLVAGGIIAPDVLLQVLEGSEDIRQVVQPFNIERYYATRDHALGLEGVNDEIRFTIAPHELVTGGTIQVGGVTLEVLDKLGKGGFSTVYRVKPQGSSQEMALKLTALTPLEAKLRILLDPQAGPAYLQALAKIPDPTMRLKVLNDSLKYYGADSGLGVAAGEIRHNLFIRIFNQMEQMEKGQPPVTWTAGLKTAIKNDQVYLASTLNPSERAVFDKAFSAALHEFVTNLARDEKLRPSINTVFSALQHFLDEESILLHLQNNLVSGVPHLYGMAIEQAKIKAIDAPNAPEESRDVAFALMSLVKGEDIEDVMPTRLEDMVSITADLLSTLSQAHKVKRVHTDVKTPNIRIEKIRGQYMRPQLLDWVTGRAHGTPGYIAPEKLAGKKGAYIDVFSTGIVLYEMLTGESPYDQVIDLQVKRNDKSINNLPDSMIADNLRKAQSRQNFPDGLIDVVIKATRLDYTQRYQTAEEFRAALLSVRYSLPPVPAFPNVTMKVLAGAPPEVTSYITSIKQASQTLPMESAFIALEDFASQAHQGDLAKFSSLLAAKAMGDILQVHTLAENPAFSRRKMDMTLRWLAMLNKAGQGKNAFHPELGKELERFYGFVDTIINPKDQAGNPLLTPPNSDDVYQYFQCMNLIFSDKQYTGSNIVAMEVGVRLLPHMIGTVDWMQRSNLQIPAYIHKSIRDAFVFYDHYLDWTAHAKTNPQNLPAEYQRVLAPANMYIEMLTRQYQATRDESAKNQLLYLQASLQQQLAAKTAAGSPADSLIESKILGLIQNTLQTF